MERTSSERPALLAFLDDMIAASSVEEALRQRLLAAGGPPRPKTLRVSRPEDLRRARLPDLPANISLKPGRIEITAGTAVAMLESLLALAMVMQNDLDRFQQAIRTASSRRGARRRVASTLQQTAVQQLSAGPIRPVIAGLCFRISAASPGLSPEHDLRPSVARALPEVRLSSVPSLPAPRHVPG